ncbi:hypothetical protein [Vibrio sp. 10N]|uniref:hypothetical protein n=1 Tax=Vibrio sp. 10N TaxID=3058938 RepID=UPI002813B621|nr:hypothetical protein VB10N_20380 [Vibrio sp. 10N]
MNLNLTKGQTIPLTIDSTWLFVESISGKLSVQIDATGESFSLPNRSVFRYGKPLGRILLSGEGALSLEHGVGDFTPPVEGQKLDIQTMPSVSFLPGQTVGVTELPKVEIEVGQSVGVSSLPKVQIEDGQQVEVKTLPDVQLKSGQSVNVGTMPSVELAAGQTIKVLSGSALSSLSGEMPLEVPANPARKGVIIKASSANAGLISLNGFELTAGEKLTVETAATFTLTGTAPDKAQVLEY